MQCRLWHHGVRDELVSQGGAGQVEVQQAVQDITGKPLKEGSGDIAVFSWATKSRKKLSAVILKQLRFLGISLEGGAPGILSSVSSSLVVLVPGPICNGPAATAQAIYDAQQHSAEEAGGRRVVKARLLDIPVERLRSQPVGGVGGGGSMLSMEGTRHEGQLVGMVRWSMDRPWKVQLVGGEIHDVRTNFIGPLYLRHCFMRVSYAPAS